MRMKVMNVWMVNLAVIASSCPRYVCIKVCAPSTTQLVSSSVRCWWNAPGYCLVSKECDVHRGTGVTSVCSWISVCSSVMSRIHDPEHWNMIQLDKDCNQSASPSPECRGHPAWVTPDQLRLTTGLISLLALYQTSVVEKQALASWNRPLSPLLVSLCFWTSWWQGHESKRVGPYHRGAIDRWVEQKLMQFQLKKEVWLSEV